jgi:hypothetical protein
MTSEKFNEMQSCVIQFSKFSVKPDFDWIINHELHLVADSHSYLGIEPSGNKVRFLEQQRLV